MAKQETENSRYPSIFAPETFVTIAQYLSEYICKRQSLKKNINLPLYFWKKSPMWEKEFLKQIRFANSLLKLYSKEAISLALKKNKWITTLGVKIFHDKVKNEQEQLDLKEKVSKESIATKEEVVINPTDASLPYNRPTQENNSTFNKLKDL